MTTAVEIRWHVDKRAYIAETADGEYRVVWNCADKDGGRSHGFHLEAQTHYSGRGREWTEVGYRTLGDQSRALSLNEAKQEIREWVNWINSGQRTSSNTQREET